MPRYLAVEWNGCSVSTRPIGWRRFFCIGKTGLLPYIVDDKIKLRVTIKQGKSDVQDDTLYWDEIVAATAIDEHDQEKRIDQQTFRNKPKQKLSLNIIRQAQSTPCDGFYVIYSDKNSERKTIMSFHAYHSEAYLGGFIVLLAGSFAGISTLIIWLLSLLLDNCS